MAARLAGFAIGGSGVEPGGGRRARGAVERARPPDRPRGGLGGGVGPDAPGRGRRGPAGHGAGPSSTASASRVPRHSVAGGVWPRGGGAGAEGRARDHLRECGLGRAGGALVTLRAERAAATADLVLALSLEAIAANPSTSWIPWSSPRSPSPARSSPASQHRRGQLAGSTRAAAGASVSVQDPLSFRVGPQVHGGFREGARLSSAPSTSRSDPRERRQPGGHRH